MYLIKHTKNKNYYKNKICNNLKHFVYGENDARKFRTKKEAQKILDNFNHKEYYEIVKI